MRVEHVDFEGHNFCSKHCVEGEQVEDMIDGSRGLLHNLFASI